MLNCRSVLVKSAGRVGGFAAPLLQAHSRASASGQQAESFTHNGSSVKIQLNSLYHRTSRLNTLDVCEKKGYTIAIKYERPQEVTYVDELSPEMLEEAALTC